VVPPFTTELLWQNQVALPLGMASSECSEMSKVGSGSSSGGADSGASSPLAVAKELWATVSLPASSLVAKECLAVADVLDSPSVDVLTSELQLSITFKVLHRLDMAGRSRSLSKEELDLVQFLVAQVDSLSSSLACKTSFAESSVPTPMAR
jgi:hypothetical protein